MDTARPRCADTEDLVFAVRDAFFDVSDLGLAPFTVPAVAEVELVSEKIRTLVQRAQPRDLFDLHLYLTDSGWHLDPRELRQVVDAKLQTTRVKRWRSGLWKAHLDEIERTWETTLREWIEPSRIPDFAETVRVVEARLRALGL